ncbi:Cytochrome c-type biogenesis protein CcmC, putative heme lyase for CcmE [Olavius sp. associated proteobacterium Delta 1]|nr:Cytochrome c-type biogenesis protein CcmC, putative heme lyase for CcmE [Olavius sp. associated proteobacterium Delta 1]
MKLTQTLWITFQFLTYVLMLLALYAIFLYAPVEKTMGVVQKIFYIHVPAAFLAYLAFFITFIASIFYLYRKDPKWDTVAHCAVETGVIFCTIVLITGPIWAKPVWNVWWTWDPRLTTTLILWFTYVAYLMLRRSVKENQRANLSAVFGIIGFINVPITFFSIRLWRTIHPVIITSRGLNMSWPMKLSLIITVIAFCFLFISLLVSRIRLERLKMRVAEINEIMDDMHSGRTQI